MDDVKIVSRLKHENIVRLYGYFLEKAVGFRHGSGRQMSASAAST